MEAAGSRFGELREKIIALRTTLLGAFGVMMVAMTLAGLLNYVFSIIMTRMLGETGAFADFNSLNSVFLIVTMGALAFQTVITKNVAELSVREENDKIRALIHEFSRWLIWICALVIVIGIAAAWPLTSVLKLGSPVYVIIIASAVAVTLYLTLPYGLLQGQQKFIGLGVAGIAASSLRIVIGVAIVALGAGVYGALGAATLAGICVSSVVIYYYRDIFRGKAEPVEGFHPASALWAIVPVAAAVFLVIFMTQIDMILVKAVKSAAQADLYSYGALAGKAVLFFPGGITLVMFPRVSALRAEGKPTKHILAWSLAACLAMEGAVVGFYALFPAFTSSFFAGKHGKEVSSLTGAFGMEFVVLFGLVMAVFALLGVLVYYHLALDRRGFIALLVAGAVAEVIGIFLFHSTLPDVLLVMLVVGAALLVANLALAFREKPAPPPA